MIKANELRIGDLVSFKGKWNGIIEELRSGSVTIKDNDGVFPYDVFEGIELNEDILLKCGFVKGVDNVFFLKTNLFYIRIFEEIGHVLFSLDKYSNSLKVSDSTKHLHQLQNLYFCLCGNELEINL